MFHPHCLISLGRPVEQPHPTRERVLREWTPRASIFAGLNARDSYAPGPAIAINCAVLLPSGVVRGDSGQNGGEKNWKSRRTTCAAPVGSLREISMRDVTSLPFSLALLKGCLKVKKKNFRVSGELEKFSRKVRKFWKFTRKASFFLIFFFFFAKCFDIRTYGRAEFTWWNYRIFSSSMRYAAIAHNIALAQYNMLIS